MNVTGKTTLPDKLEVTCIYIMHCLLPGITLFYRLQLFLCCILGTHVQCYNCVVGARATRRLKKAK